MRSRCDVTSKEKAWLLDEIATCALNGDRAGLTKALRNGLDWTLLMAERAADPVISREGNVNWYAYNEMERTIRKRAVSDGR